MHDLTIITLVYASEYADIPPGSIRGAVWDITSEIALERDEHTAEQLRISCEGMESYPEMERV